jgi:hypothetical protein
LEPTGKIEGGETTISSLAFAVPERHAETKWRTKPTYTDDQGTESKSMGSVVRDRPEAWQ